MKILGTKLVKLASLLLPGDMPARQKTTNAKDLAGGLEKWGRFIHDPLVRAEDMRIIAGRDRIAGAMRLGRKELEVKLCEATDDECEELELVENLHRRRDNEGELRQRHLDLLERLAAGRAKEPGKREPTPRGAAREELAAKIGVTKNALEKQESRRRQKAEEEEVAAGWGEDEPEAEAPPPVELLGVHPAPEWLTGVSEVQGLLDQADRQARELQATLTKLHGARLALPAARWQRLYQGAHSLAHDIRAARPVSVCAFCKHVPLLMGACTACNKAGYLSEQDMAGVPAELLVEDQRLVAQNGRFVRMDLVRAELVAPPGRQRRMRVEDEDGNELLVGDE